MKCPRCKGRKIEESFNPSYNQPCPRCEGKGEIPDCFERTNLRKCVVSYKTYKKDKDKNTWMTIEHFDTPAVFHTWGLDLFEQCEAPNLALSKAIVELKNGTIKMIDPENIKFINPTE